MLDRVPNQRFHPLADQRGLLNNWRRVYTTPQPGVTGGEEGGFAHENRSATERVPGVVPDFSEFGGRPGLDRQLLWNRYRFLRRGRAGRRRDYDEYRNRYGVPQGV